MADVLALSSSRVGGGGYLEEAAPMMADFLGDRPLQVAFIPFALVDGQFEQLHALVTEALKHLPYVIRLVTEVNGKEMLESADVIMVSGGNTFKLLHDLYNTGLLELIRTKVGTGTKYVGWSAGSNITGLTISTTNDMPIIQPQSFRALGLLPFQLNPHYLNQPVVGFHGETRDQRLGEFVQLNPGIPVLGLPEGTALELRGNSLRYLGNVPGVLFQNGIGNIPGRKEILVGSDLSFLLNA